MTRSRGSAPGISIELEVPFHDLDALQIVWHGNYLPFGEPNGSGGTATVNLRMPGQYFDAESGFNHNGARDGRQDRALPAGPAL